MKISVQMYSVRQALAADFPGTVQRLCDLGFDTAEPFGLVEFRDDLVRARERFDITFPSAHQSFLGDVDFDEVLEAANAVGVTYLVDPFWEPADWQDPARVRDLAGRLNARAEQAAEAGIRVGYHNHHFELAAQLDSRSALELFAEHLAPRVVLEIDTYWAVVGGADITTLLATLGERVKLVHLKDGDLAQDPAGQLPVGAGRMPLEETLTAAAGVEYGVIEFDEYDGDVFEGLEASLRRLRAEA
ncbi:sugar phosphate isomerase/epimerase family protein [Brachybacterium sacelli]|uniref:Sugar phosphate isomerase/epimerase n=1 Tax=Brachybacterium sacelli TaxID=173364 RepID=A0ABS4WWB4_9MICO|nr:TIM barrel protein [Brachybacterium sacelli]MBP2380500.1 sugar phosphate isomerase/epimerase [Brachybacterium sacelli]